MTTGTLRQAALERATQIRIKWAAYADGQDWIDDLRWLCDAVEQAASEGNPHCRPENHPDDCEPNEIRDLADAYAAIREANALVKRLIVNGFSANRYKAWLALPAVSQALKEGKG